MADDLRFNLGALRSAMQLTIHTHHAARIWNGRAASEGKPAIIGLNGFVSIASKMYRGAQQDDPYSDWWILRLEEKLEDTKAQLTALAERVAQALASLPIELSVTENLNVQPVKLPLFVSSQLGFLAIYLLTDFDKLVRKIILAHHTAVIDRPQMERWLNEGAHCLRSTFALAQRYQYSGSQRDDFASNNAVARTARERFGDLPQDVLEGTRRSRYAPPIIRRSGLSQKEAQPALDASAEIEDATAAGPAPEEGAPDEDAPAVGGAST